MTEKYSTKFAIQTVHSILELDFPINKENVGAKTQNTKQTIESIINKEVTDACT